jgi:hypothetical protein
MNIKNFESFSLNEGTQGGGNKFILVRFGATPSLNVSRYFAKIALKNPKPTLMKGQDSFVTMFETALTKEALIAGFDVLGIKYNLYQIVHTSTGGAGASIVAREPNKAQLKELLRKAIAAEDYDKAADLRDKIASLEGAPAAPTVTPVGGVATEGALYSFDEFLLESEYSSSGTEELSLLFSQITEKTEVFTGEKKKAKASAESEKIERARNVYNDKNSSPKDKKKAAEFLDKIKNNEDYSATTTGFNPSTKAQLMIKRFKTLTFPQEPFKREYTEEEKEALNDYFAEYSHSKIGADGKIVLSGGIPGEPGIYYITEDDLKIIMEQK